MPSHDRTAATADQLAATMTQTHRLDFEASKLVEDPKPARTRHDELEKHDRRQRHYRERAFAWLQECAYALWQLDGSPACDGKKYWYEAESLLYLDPEHVEFRPAWVIKSHALR